MAAELGYGDATIAELLGHARRGGSAASGLEKALGHSVQGGWPLEGVRLHDLRHSFASFGAVASLGLPIIGKLLGHSQPATTARYAHLDADLMRRAAETIGATISAMAKVVTLCPSPNRGQMMRPPQIWARADNGSDFKPLKINGFLSDRSNSKQPPNNPSIALCETCRKARDRPGSIDPRRQKRREA